MLQIPWSWAHAWQLTMQGSSARPGKHIISNSNSVPFGILHGQPDTWMFWMESLEFIGFWIENQEIFSSFHERIVKFATRICPSYSHTDHEVQRCQVLFHFLYECKVRNPNVKSRAPSPDAIAWSVRILPVGLPLVPVLHKRTALYQAQHRHALSPKTPTISNLNVRNTFSTCMEAEKLWSLVITKSRWVTSGLSDLLPTSRWVWTVFLRKGV